MRETIADAADSRLVPYSRVAEAAALERVTGFHFHRGCLALAYRQQQQSQLPEVVVSLYSSGPRESA
jgi:hypothetical protein